MSASEPRVSRRARAARAVETGRPLLPDVGVLALVPDRWTDPWMPRHQVLRRLAGYFQVVWMDPPPHWRDLLAHPGRWSPRDARPEPGLVVHRSDFRLPHFHRPRGLAERAYRARLRSGTRILDRRGCRERILYLWRPGFEPALAEVETDLVCYHIDDEYTFVAEERPIPPPERRLLEEADRVFIHSPALMEKKGGVNPRTSLVPNGVDFAAFSTPVPEPEDLARVPHPRIGYAGWLKKQLDWDLVVALARGHPEWHFVLVGGHAPHPELEAPLSLLEELGNIHFLGAKPPEALSAYPQHFDVCLMPYDVNPYTECIYPLKLHEYLATGRPVVGTPIRTLREFDQVVTLAEGPEGWSRAIEAALSPAENAHERREARRRVARAHDWDALVLRIARTMAGDLGEEEASRLEARLAEADLSLLLREAVEAGTSA